MPDDVVEFRVNKKSDLSIHKLVLIKFVNRKETEWRKCQKCGDLRKAPNSGTSGLRLHLTKCPGNDASKDSRDVNQDVIPFAKKPKLDDIPQLMHKISRLVYEDNLTINTVVNSSTLKWFFEGRNVGKVTYHKLNKVLDADYQFLFAKVKSFIESRDKKQVLFISFDKWTAQDGKKIMGVYLYVGGENVCLGLIHFRGFCGAEEMC